MWKKFQPNPKGIITNDCTVRMLCAVTGWDWYKAHDVLCTRSRDLADVPSSDRVWQSVLTDLGFSRQRIIDSCPECYTVIDFTIDHPQGLYVLTPYQHVIAVINGDYFDSWDSGEMIPLAYYRR